MKILRGKLNNFYQRSTTAEKDLLKGTGWNIFGNGIGKFSLLLSAIFVARILGPDQFGKWGVIRSTSAIFTILLGFGVGVTAVRYVAEYREIAKNKAGNILGIAISFAAVFGLILSVVFYFLSNFIAVKVLQDASLEVPLQISSVFLILIAVNGVLSGALAGLNSFSSIAVANLIGGIAGTFVIIYLSKTIGLEGLVLGYVFYYFLTFIVLLFYFRRKLKEFNITVSLKEYKEHLPVIFTHNLPAILSGGIGGFVVWGVMAYVARLTAGFSIIGLNNAAKIAQNAIMEIAAQIDIPIISYLSASKENKRQNKINLFSPLLIGSFLILPLIYIPDIIFYFFAKSEFENEDFLLVISLTMLTTYIMIYKRGMGRSIITKNLLWWGVYENLFWGFLLISFTLIFVFDYGSVGLAFAFALAYFVDLLVITPFYYKKKLIGKTLALSIESILLWLVVLNGCFLIYLGVDLVPRIIIYLMTIIVQVICLRRIFNRV